MDNLVMIATMALSMVLVNPFLRANEVKKENKILPIITEEGMDPADWSAEDEDAEESDEEESDAKVKKEKDSAK